MSVASPAAPAALIWQMRSVACNLCGEESSTEIYPSRLPDLAGRDIQEIYSCTSSAYGECGPIVRCVACGLMFQNPQPDPESILTAYENVVDARYAEEREGRIHTFRRALIELEAHAGPGRLLDVGSHLGVFVEVAREAGWDAEGVEPSRWAAEVAHSRGLPVICGTLAQLPADGASYDAVTLWDVIEHLPDPSGELRRLHALLRPRGVLAISTMDVEAPIARLLGRHWPWYMQMHLFYFSRRTLGRLVESCGYEVLEIRRHRRIVRLGYLLAQLERRLGFFHRPLVQIVEGIKLGDRLLAVDLGDIITLFARKRSSEPRVPG